MLGISSKWRAPSKKMMSAVPATFFQKESKIGKLTPKESTWLVEEKKKKLMANLLSVSAGDGYPLMTNKNGMKDPRVRQALLNALSVELNQVYNEEEDSAIDRKFIDGFIQWIQGELPDDNEWADKIKNRTWWWWIPKNKKLIREGLRGKDGPYSEPTTEKPGDMQVSPLPLSGEDFVVYLRRMIGKKFKFMEQLEILKNFIPPDLPTAWLYWKYIVNGHGMLDTDIYLDVIPDLQGGQLSKPIAEWRKNDVIQFEDPDTGDAPVTTTETMENPHVDPSTGQSKDGTSAQQVADVATTVPENEEEENEEEAEEDSPEGSPPGSPVLQRTNVPPTKVQLTDAGGFVAGALDTQEESDEEADIERAVAEAISDDENYDPDNQDAFESWLDEFMTENPTIMLSDRDAKILYKEGKGDLRFDIGEVEHHLDRAQNRRFLKNSRRADLRDELRVALGSKKVVSPQKPPRLYPSLKKLNAILHPIVNNNPAPVVGPEPEKPAKTIHVANAPFPLTPTEPHGTPIYIATRTAPSLKELAQTKTLQVDPSLTEEDLRTYYSAYTAPPPPPLVETPPPTPSVEAPEQVQTPVIPPPLGPGQPPPYTPTVPSPLGPTGTPTSSPGITASVFDALRNVSNTLLFGKQKIKKEKEVEGVPERERTPDYPEVRVKKEKIQSLPPTLRIFRQEEHAALEALQEEFAMFSEAKKVEEHYLENLAKRGGFTPEHKELWEATKRQYQALKSDVKKELHDIHEAFKKDGVLEKEQNYIDRYARYFEQLERIARIRESGVRALEPRVVLIRNLMSKIRTAKAEINDPRQNMNLELRGALDQDLNTELNKLGLELKGLENTIREEDRSTKEIHLKISNDMLMAGIQDPVHQASVRRMIAKIQGHHTDIRNKYNAILGKTEGRTSYQGYELSRAKSEEQAAFFHEMKALQFHKHTLGMKILGSRARALMQQELLNKENQDKLPPVPPINRGPPKVTVTTAPGVQYHSPSNIHRPPPVFTQESAPSASRLPRMQPQAYASGLSREEQERRFSEWDRIQQEFNNIKQKQAPEKKKKEQAQPPRQSSSNFGATVLPGFEKFSARNTGHRLVLDHPIREVRTPEDLLPVSERIIHRAHFKAAMESVRALGQFASNPTNEKNPLTFEIVQETLKDLNVLERYVDAYRPALIKHPNKDLATNFEQMKEDFKKLRLYIGNKKYRKNWTHTVASVEKRWEILADLLPQL